MPFNPQHIIDAYLEHDADIPYRAEHARIEVREIGQLRLPTGRITAFDPIMCLGTDPFTRTAPVGTYPVRLAIAHFDNPDQRIAYAGIFFSDRKAEVWEQALIPGQNPAQLGPNWEYGYPVDCGTGCFADAETAFQFGGRMHEQKKYSDEICSLLDETYIDTRSWADVTPVDGGGNVMLFSSGYGDGSYPSFFGIDSDGEPSCLITDFYILGDEEEDEPAAPKKWWRFWKR